MSSKVFAREQAFIGLGEGRDLKLLKGELYDADDEIVQKFPELFAPVAESTDARVTSLERQLADQSAQVEKLLAALAEKDAATAEVKEPAKTTANKSSAAAPADGKELKGEVA